MDEDDTFREKAAESAKKANTGEPFHGEADGGYRDGVSVEDYGFEFEDLPVPLETVLDLLNRREEVLPQELRKYARINHGFSEAHNLVLASQHDRIPTEEGIWRIIGHADDASAALAAYVAKNHTEEVKQAVKYVESRGELESGGQ